MRKKHYIQILILSLLAFNCMMLQGGLLVHYVIGVLVPFILLIVLQIRDAYENYIEYVKAGYEEKKPRFVLAEIYGRKITQSFFERITPFVESISIKMNAKGVHSIHAAPVV